MNGRMNGWLEDARGKCSMCTLPEAHHVQCWCRKKMTWSLFDDKGGLASADVRGRNQGLAEKCDLWG